jgi:hypothetical protein
LSTVSKDIADKIVANNGIYPGDLIRVCSIWKYTSKWNTECYKLFYAYGMILDETEYTQNPTLYWKHKEFKLKDSENV